MGGCVMLFIVAAAGIIGAIVLGLIGLTEGASGGEPYRILALACLFATAASVLGTWLDDGVRSRTRTVVTRDEVVHLLMATPLVLLMLWILVVMLIPSIFVMLPIFAAWYYASRPGPSSTPTPPSRAPEPAYAQ